MCPDKKLLSAYVDNALNEESGKEIKEHLGTCLSCHKQAEGYLSLRALLLNDPSPALHSAEQEAATIQFLLKRRNFLRCCAPPRKKLLIKGSLAAFPFAALFLYLISTALIGNDREVNRRNGGFANTKSWTASEKPLERLIILRPDEQNSLKRSFDQSENDLTIILPDTEIDLHGESRLLPGSIKTAQKRP